MKKNYWIFIALIIFLKCSGTDSRNSIIDNSNFYKTENDLRFYKNRYDSSWYLFKTLSPVIVNNELAYHFLFASSEEFMTFNFRDYVILKEKDRIYRYYFTDNSKNLMLDFNKEKIITKGVYNVFGKDTVLLKDKFYSLKYLDTIFCYEIHSKGSVYCSEKPIPRFSKIQVSKKVGLIKFNVIVGSKEKEYEWFHGLFTLKENAGNGKWWKSSDN